MKLQEICTILERIAPSELAEEWDNVGLLAGDPGRPVTRAMLAIDLTRDVLAEAKKKEDQSLSDVPPADLGRDQTGGSGSGGFAATV